MWRKYERFLLVMEPVVGNLCLWLRALHESLLMHIQRLLNRITEEIVELPLGAVAEGDLKDGCVT